MPKEKMKSNKPPTKTAPLKSSETSPTPSSLRAFCCQLNQGEKKVANNTNIITVNDPRIPQMPVNFMIL